MEPLSRRSALRLGAGAATAAGIVLGSALVEGGGLLAPAAARPPRIGLRLGRDAYGPGDVMTLEVVERVKGRVRVRVKDSSGLEWRRVSRSGNRQTWTATAAAAGTGAVKVVIKRRDDGRVFRRRIHYAVAVPPVPTGRPLVGMSAPSDLWGQRVAEVGTGLAARRIFADLSSGATSQIRLVEEAHAAGLLPVISYKVGNDIAGAAAGTWNAVAEQAAVRLASYGLPTAVTFWHEPHGDMTPAQYVAASQQLLPIFKRGELRVGPLLNGWLLDNQQATFGSFCPDELFGLWDWMGIDTYESGTLEAPGPRKPAERIGALSAYVRARGFDLPLGIGEYNGYSSTSIVEAGEALLSTPNVWFGCVWNSTGEKGYALEGDRLAAFRQTLADPRSAEPR